MSLDNYNNIWAILDALITLLTLGLAFYIFFTDPIRKWAFLGYRPTIIIIPFDPNTQKVLLIQSPIWSFNQGGIFNNDIYLAVEQTLEKELSLPKTSYKLFFVTPLGTTKIKDKNRVKRIALGSISLFPNIRGKGYIGCFVTVNLTSTFKNIKVGYGIDSAKVFTIKEASKLVTAHFDENNPDKQKIHRKIFAILNNFINNWSTRKRNI